MLEAHNDSILQENLFKILTSLEMVALARTISIIHFKLAMPMRWLAGSTHHMYDSGYNWSAQLMGKVIDALHDGLVEIEKDGTKFLDETFINSLFDKIHVDGEGNPGKLEPLVEYMEYNLGKCYSK